jgi:hypothetical protein
MANKAKRLVSESRTQLIDCRRLLHIVLFRRALAHFPQSPDHRPSVSAIVSSYARHTRRALDTICGRECQAVISRRSIS